MGLATAVKSCFRQFATFSGRARRAEYWMFYLFLQLLGIGGFLLVLLIGLGSAFLFSDQQDPSPAALIPYFVALGIWGLGTLVLMIPYLAVSARRLHDMGQSGHWLWLNLVGLSIVPFIMAFLDSEWGTNRWGPDPKAEERAMYAPPQQYGQVQYGQPSYEQPQPNPPAPPTP